MTGDEFEGRMRAFEYFHEVRLLPDAWIVLRVDGRGFSRFTERRFEKPFDAVFHTMMVATARTLLGELQGVYAYTESDEISVLVRRDWGLFDRGLEKAVSISAGIASAAFTLACGEAAHFDSRVWLGPSVEHVVDYFRWRQADATRCALNGWCYWTLRKEGKSVREATRLLDRMPVAEKHELLFARGVNFNDLPAWQRRGTGLYWESYEKDGFDPIRNVPVTAARRRVRVDEGLPMKEAYDRFVAERVASATRLEGTEVR